MLLILDFDGVFVPYSIFIETVRMYGKEKKIQIDDIAIEAIKQSIINNQNELNLSLNVFGIDDLKYLEELYHEKAVLNSSAEKFLEFCQSNSIKYVFFSSANPERIIATFSKYNIQFNHQDIYYTKSKKYQDVYEFKQKLFSRFGENSNKLVYVDDYPPALSAGKKNDFSTIMMLDKTVYSKKLEIEFDNFIDHKVESFLELEELIKGLL